MHSEHIGKRLNVLEMSCLRKMCGVTLRDRIRNEEIRNRCGVKKSLSVRGEESICRLYGHLERMSDERLTKKIHCAVVEGSRSKGRPRKKWKEGVNDLLRERANAFGMSVDSMPKKRTGLLATGTSCLAEVWVSGRSRVPLPPERINPFIQVSPWVVVAAATPGSGLS